MSDNSLTYKIIFPEGYLAGPEIAQKDGMLDNLFVRFEDGRLYKLLFLDFYLLAEEFVRYTVLFKLDWFAESGLVVVSKITPEIIREAVEALQEQGYFEHFNPISNDRRKRGKLKEAPQFEVTFPAGYLPPDAQTDFNYSGLVPGIIVEVEDGRTYQLQVEDFFSFTKRFAGGARFDEVYFAEPSFVIVPRVTPEIINKAISWLLEHDYFERLKPLA